MITWNDFSKIDLRTGTIIRAEEFPEARKPAIQVWIDFGELGIKKSSAQITDAYLPNQLIGKQIIAVVNFPPKQIGPFMSECLLLGCVGDEQGVILLTPDKAVRNGLKIA